MRDGVSSVYLWQFASREWVEGFWLPQVRFELKTTDDTMNNIKVWWLEGVEPIDRFAPDTFAVAVPPETTIVDSRNDDRKKAGRPRTTRTRAIIPEVLADALRRPPSVRSMQTALKFGDPAPALDVSTWVDASGEIDAPDLIGKIVVVDFWGMGCGFCINELSEMRAAAKHFADSGVVFLSIYDD